MTPDGEGGELSPRAPAPEGLNAEFYAQAADGVLHLQQCAVCARFRHPPRYACPHCGSSEYRWTPSGGEGRLFTWTVTHRAYDRRWTAALPYATVAVELVSERVRVIAAFGGDDLSLLAPGLAVRVEVDTASFAFPFLRARLRPLP